MPTAPEAGALNRILEPVSRCLTPGVARQLVKLRADPETQARIDKLADKCNEGQLTKAERDFLTILQLKARSLLERHR
jgi:hypothetical protein